MKRLPVLFVAVGLLASTSGCCWWWPGYYGGYGQGYGLGCPTGNCGVTPSNPVIPQTGAIYGTYDTIQAGVPTAAPITAVAPTTVAPYPTTTALAPLESLPTY